VAAVSISPIGAAGRASERRAAVQTQRPPLPAWPNGLPQIRAEPLGASVGVRPGADRAIGN
jgi:hypothetical protein